jgi:protein-L-isoaspartate(D-aspartate) O-methyltransferase
VLLDQLAEGGRLVAPVGSRSYQDLTVVGKSGGVVTEETAGGCTFVPLLGEYGWKAGDET